MNFPKSGNTIWFNRAFLYFHKYKADPHFTREFHWIMKEIGMIPDRKSKP